MNTQCRISDCEKAVVARGLCRGHYHRDLTYGDPLAGGTAKGALSRWIADHADYAGDDCLEWPFHTNEFGYGPSRQMCVAAHGAPPSDVHQSAHSCGNGHLGCMNPKHLRWATAKENAADRAIHGTDNAGIFHYRSKLTADQVREIRHNPAKKRHADLAREFGVTQGTIHGIANGNGYRNVL